jgi:TldD protein
MTTAPAFATAESTLLAPNEVDAAQLDGIFGRLMTRTGPTTPISTSSTRAPKAGAWRKAGEIRQLQHRPGRGRARVVSGEKTAFAYSDDISLPALEAARTPRAPSPPGRPSGIARVPSRAVAQLYQPHRSAREPHRSRQGRAARTLEDYARARTRA